MKGASAIPVFMYHHVSPTPGVVTISPATFRQYIATLANAGWRTAGLDDLAAFLSGATVPARTCILTFDDGYLDNFVHAHPVLRKFGLHAVLFDVTGWRGSGPARPGTTAASSHAACTEAIAAGHADEVMLRWSEVEIMQAAGTFEFHSHTHTYQRWDRLLPDPVARREALSAACNGRKNRWFSISAKSPSTYVGHKATMIPSTRSCTIQVGFKYLYTTEKRVVSRVADAHRIGRIVTKEKPGKWLFNRASWFPRPWLGNAYTWIQGR